MFCPSVVQGDTHEGSPGLIHRAATIYRSGEIRRRKSLNAASGLCYAIIAEARRLVGKSGVKEFSMHRLDNLVGKLYSLDGRK